MKILDTRSFAKALTWRLLASLTTFLVAWAATGKLAVSTSIAGAEMFVKIFLYYLHERGWSYVRWERKSSATLSRAAGD